ncbi:hypothetical protein Maes01_00816 [Microbulbifer aestuariivivens]|uniref:Uncharacterized protein n=1 Tax=Microbulbifer aestuariivivens TaxID=1908308 RepID=A0ABP9WM56_9GAMM
MVLLPFVRHTIAIGIMGVAGVGGPEIIAVEYLVAVGVGVLREGTGAKLKNIVEFVLIWIFLVFI